MSNKIKNIKNIILVTLIIIFIVTIGNIFRNIYIDYSYQKKNISNFKNTRIEETIIINDKKMVTKKPFKKNGNIVYVPIIEFIENFDVKYGCEFKFNKEIKLEYRNVTYKLKRGSNIVHFYNSENEVKLKGTVEVLDNTVYVPIDFIYDVMDINVIYGKEKKVYMNNYPYKFNYDWTKNEYIAHALGGIDGIDYTNSKEALEYNYKKGKRVFEADLVLTSDNKIVLLHAWSEGTLKKFDLPLDWAKNLPTEKEFKSKLLLGKYHTMSFEDLVKFMDEHEDVSIVIDLKGGSLKSAKEVYPLIVETAVKINASTLNRMIPQIYNMEMLKVIMDEHQFKSMIFSLYKLEHFYADRVVEFAYEHGIKVVATDASRYTLEFLENLNDKGIKMYMFTYNNPDFVKKMKARNVSGFYTDFLPEVNSKSYK